MTLLDATPPKPPRKMGRYILIPLGVVIAVGIAFVAFRNFLEERAVSRFLTTLAQVRHGEGVFELF